MGRTSERQEINAPLICETLQVLSGKLGPTYFDPAERLKAETSVHLVRRALAQNSGSTVATQSRVVYVAFAPGTVKELAVFIETAPTTGSFTVDLQKSTGGGGFATVLTAVVTINNAKSNLSRTLATLATSVAYIAGDAFKIIIADSSNDGQGVCAEATFYEDGEA